MNKNDSTKHLLEIINRNLPFEQQYTSEEIQAAFSKADHSLGTQKEQNLYSIFFKEFTPEQIKDLTNDLSISIRHIKTLYKTSPYRKSKKIAKKWDSRFRLKSVVVDKIVPRKDDKYKEIDTFKAYELTPCIAYEMAIRNKEVQKILIRLETISKMMLDEKFLFKRYSTRKDFENDEEYKKYESLVIEKHTNYIKFIEQDHKKFIDEYINKCTELGIYHLKILKEKLENELINEYLIYPTGYERKILNSSPVMTEKVNNKYSELETVKFDKESDDIVFERIVHDEFIEVQGLYANNNAYFINNIIPNFKRQVNDQNQITIPVNLSLPLVEITEYIKIIQKKAKIKSPLEFLEGQLKRADNLTNMNTKDKKGSKISLDMTRGEEPQEKLADMLYIYDMKKMDFTNTEIIYEIDKYYSKKSTSMSEATLREYLVIAIDYIENQRYKELIIGKTAQK